MLVFGAPAVLLAGALAALVPIGLHLLRPVPGERRPLPTARFLTSQPRNRLRVARPDQPLLLVLRILILLLTGAALARPGWRPAGRGAAEIVLLDRAAPGPAAWRAALDSARVRAGDRGTILVFDSVARGLDAGEALDPVSRSDLGVALASLPRVARGLAADSLRLTVVSPMAAASWGARAGALRPAVWPGRITLVDAWPAPSAPAPAPPAGAAVLAAEGAGRHLLAAAGAAGLTLATVDSARVIFVARRTTATEDARLERRRAAGATVVRDAAAAPGTPLPGTGTVEVPGAAPVPGAAGRIRLPLPAGTRLAGGWEDGTAAVTAEPAGPGCRVRFGARLEGGELPTRAAYPHLVAALAAACAADLPPPGELDDGARSLLAGQGPEWVSAAALGAVAPVPLGRWLMLLAGLAALAELVLARRRTA